MRPLGSADRALTGAASAFLTPRLGAAAAHLGAGERALVALTLVCKIGDNRLMKNGFVDLGAKHALAQLELAGDLAAHVYNGYLRHILFLLLLRV